MSLPPISIVAENGTISDEQLAELLRGNHCYTPFSTMGQGAVAVPAWPAVIPPRWAPAVQAYQQAFADAYTSAAKV
jgi:hypothetical protein